MLFKRSRKSQNMTLAEGVVKAFHDAGLRRAGDGRPGYSVTPIREGMVKVAHVQNDAPVAEQREQLKGYASLLAYIGAGTIRVHQRTSLREPAHLVVSLLPVRV